MYSYKGFIVVGLEVSEQTITCRVADVINGDLQCSQQINNMSTQHLPVHLQLNVHTITLTTYLTTQLSQKSHIDTAVTPTLISLAQLCNA